MDDLLQLGITAYKAGKREEARRIFIAAVKKTPDSERAWGWMYQTSGNDKERMYCLKQMLRINPRNEKTSLLLNQLIEQPPAPAVPPPGPVIEPPPIHTEPPRVATRKCPHCGEEIRLEAPRCSYCGREVNVRKAASPQKTITKKKNLILPVISIVIVVGACVVIYSLLINVGKELIVQPTPTRTPQESAWYACTLFVQKQMKVAVIDAQRYNPNGVMFLDNGDYRVDVSYAKLNTTYTCILLDHAGGNWELKSLGATKN